MWIEIGRIVAPHGLNGEVRIYPDSDFPERFTQPGERWLRRHPEAEPEVVTLTQGRYLEGKGLYIVKFKGITQRHQAEALREAVLLVPEGDRLPLAPGEFHVGDLLGLQVRLQPQGTVIGTVVDVYTAGNDLLAVDLLPEFRGQPPPSPNSPKKNSPSAVDPTPVLIPFVAAIVPVVEVDAGYVEINPPPGLLP